MSKFYCRRYKLDSDPITVFKIKADSYDHPDLHRENLIDDAWYWLDMVPYVEETVENSNKS